MNRQEFENALEETLKAVDKQYIRPLMLALGTICIRDTEMSKALSEILLAQAESCRKEDLAGWALLKGLANIADPTNPPSETQKHLRIFLKTIDGGKSLNKR